MKRKSTSSKRKKTSSSNASDILRIAVTFNRPSDNLGLTRYEARMTPDVVHTFKPDSRAIDRAVAELEKRGFSVSARGEMTLSIRGKRATFERVFGTELEQRHFEDEQTRYQARSFLTVPDEALWDPDPALAALIDDAYIQWPHIYMHLFPPNAPSPWPPRVPYHHLRVPGDVALALNASRIHREGTTGRGVRVAMIDSGFAHGHAYFQKMNYNSSVVLAPGATHVNEDGVGHGTAESANLFAVAPDITFIGVKLDNENNPNVGATILEGFQEAMNHNPQVISVSLGFDLVIPGTRRHLTFLPNALKALEAEIQAAVAAGVVVVFSAGNGHVSFPGMMPEVISAGGVFVEENGALEASNYASAFQSRIYAGRRVPDFCGLVGMQPQAMYIMLPLPAGCQIDADGASNITASGNPKDPDETAANDGWAVISGTSAAAPQLAGICALLLDKNPGLTPRDIKAVLRRTGRDVVRGRANAASNQGRARRAGPGVDSATGSGLADAFAAWQQV